MTLVFSVDEIAFAADKLGFSKEEIVVVRTEYWRAYVTYARTKPRPETPCSEFDYVNEQRRAAYIAAHQYIVNTIDGWHKNQADGTK